jgi:hypothetical protein
MDAASVSRCWRIPPASFRLLLGQDVDIFQYDLPFLEGRVEAFGPEFPIYPPLMGRFGVKFDYLLDFGIGFDTAGLRAFQESGYSDLSTVFDGFYLVDRDGPEVKLGGGIVFQGFVGGDFSFFPGVKVTAIGGVDGTLGVEASFDLNDIEQDGKVRARNSSNCSATGFSVCSIRAVAFTSRWRHF